MMSNRDRNIDIIKALGIIFVVSKHCRMPGSEFLSFFEMSVFYICSGYCYKQMDYSIWSAKKYIIKKIKGLYLPYIIFNSLYIAFNNLFVRFNLLESDVLSIKEVLLDIFKTFLLHGKTEFAGPMWFVCDLFIISILYYLFDYLFSKQKYKNSYLNFTSLVFLLFGFHLSKVKNDLFGLSTVFSFFCLFRLGVILRNKNIKNLSKNYLNTLLSFTILVFMRKFGYASFVTNNYSDPIYLILGSLLKFHVLYSMSLFISKYKIINAFLCYIGKHTMFITSLHIFIFKIINYFIVRLNGLDNKLISAYPVLFTDKLWWILYLSLGIFVPALLSSLNNRIKTQLANK